MNIHDFNEGYGDAKEGYSDRFFMGIGNNNEVHPDYIKGQKQAQDDGVAKKELYYIGG